MDKETYATYEFLPTNNVGSESDQYLVVQDDGTFLITKQIQYVTQDNKEVPESSVPVYDVQSQQYFVNVNNSTQLIMPDQLILPSGSNNLYTNNNSYLLQTEGITTTTEQLEDDIADQYKQANTDVETETKQDKQINNCTEITLSDEQYQMLEQKGWILLESNDKIYVLNTLGLHDITTNDKLIHKLRNEIQNNSNVEIIPGCNKTDIIPNDNQDLATKQAPVEFIVANDEVVQNVQNVCFVVDDKEATGDEIKEEDFDYKKETQSPNAAVQDETIEVFREQDSNSIKIKTKFVFGNIPNKIILGKTANGKRIVAKVIKKNKPVTVYEKIMENKHFSELDLNESQFLALVHHALRSYSDTFYAEDVTTANAVILQLLKLPALRQSIIGQNIIVTKIRIHKDNSGKVLKNKISLVTGKIRLSSGKEECFTHIPDLLHNLLLKQDSTTPNNPDIAEAALIENDLSIFHIHVSEVVCEDNVMRVHVNLAKRQFAIDSVLDYKLRRSQTTYACGGCATMFNTSEALKEHQECQCMETEDNLSIDIDILNKNKETYSVVKNGKDKFYSCLQCDAKFGRISHCQKHVKTHFAPPSPLYSETEANSEQNNAEKEVYKCKMCPATFYHPSTLSRHIVTRHIKLKAK